MRNDYLIDRYIQRKPCGRMCRVLSATASYLLVRDFGFWTGRISVRTFEKKWQVVK